MSRPSHYTCPFRFMQHPLLWSLSCLLHPARGIFLNPKSDPVTLLLRTLKAPISLRRKAGLYHARPPGSCDLPANSLSHPSPFPSFPLLQPLWPVDVPQTHQAHVYLRAFVLPVPLLRTLFLQDAKSLLLHFLQVSAQASTSQTTNLHASSNQTCSHCQ